MPDQATIDVYETRAAAWIAERHPQDEDHVAWVDRTRRPGPVADLGSGPGWNLSTVAAPTIALDAAGAMLRRVPEHASLALPVRGGVERLPFADGSLGGAISNRVLVHLPLTEVPLALADLHRALGPEAPVFAHVLAHPDGVELRGTGVFAGRLFSAWAPDRFLEVCRGAGFTVEHHDIGRADGRHRISALRLRLRRATTLADTVGADMRLLICGLNPSPAAAASGIAFARPGNRFWPAALAAGLVTTDRDPFRAVVEHGIGMTDLVKRVTRRADELARSEYVEGLDRVDGLCRWLRPRAICFVGLAGWRAAVDRRARPGRQDRTIGGRPVYLMPSTSGLNANSSLADLTGHLRDAARLADAS